MKSNIKTVDDYISAFPDVVRERLIVFRKIITENAPNANESISYGMPAYKTHGKPLVYFAGYKGHIGFYATPTGHKEFEDELSAYKQGKGSVQFPLKTSLPTDLIARMVKFRVKENEEKYGK